MRELTRGLFRGVLHKLIATRRGVVAGLFALSMACLPAAPAIAHQNPSGCNGNRLNTSILKDRTEVVQGDTITYTITASNANSGSDTACDITNVTIEVTLPAPDGTPTGTIVVLASGINLPSGTGITVIGSTQYVVAVDPGVVDIVAQVSASGTLHDAPTDHSALIVKTVGTSVVTPPAPPTSGGSSGGSASSVPKLPNTGSL